ncbi:Fe(2+) transporter [Entomophthora muscae]|uniref:Fe(2+) transporter n=2 Tax=Entomophthora muscae TaxID=34485 RepID=A0ACC2RIB0_9FUNG|nr:Fe(2+) transporter [Entomophthora muscae]
MTEVDYEALPENTPFSVQLAAGALAGITEHIVMHPLDSIKTRMQVLSTNPQAVYTNMLQAFTRISATEGAMTLWRGAGSVVMGAGPAHALYFGTYEQTKKLFNSSGHSHTGIAAAGACSSIVSDAFMNPFDVIKQRMQIHGSQYSNIFVCAKDLFKREGITAFYISYPTTLAMTVPFQAIQFTTYEAVSDYLNPNKGYNPTSHVLAGGLAGAIAAAVTTPLDVTKTLLQTRGSSTDPEILKTSGMIKAARLIYTREGLKGFTRGLAPRVMSHMPSTALCWSAYEYFKWFLKADDTMTM